MRLTTTSAIAVSSLLLVACGPLAQPFVRSAAPPQSDPQALAEARQLDEVASLIDAGDGAAAEAQLARLLEQATPHPRALYLKGQSEALRGRSAEAVPWFERASAAAPSWPEPRLRLAECFMELNRPAAAGSVFKDLDELFPEHPAGPYGRGATAMMRDQRDVARRELDEALRRDERFLPALRLRLVVAGQDSDHLLERRLLERILSLRPLDVPSLLRQAALDEEAGRFEDARRGLELAYDRQPDTTIARRLADLARRRGDNAAATHWSEQAGIIAVPAP